MMMLGNKGLTTSKWLGYNSWLWTVHFYDMGEEQVESEGGPSKKWLRRGDHLKILYKGV